MAPAVCDALGGSIPIITFINASIGCGEPRGHSCLRMFGARSSFEPLRGEVPAGACSLESQLARASGRHLRANTQGPLNATNQPQHLPPVSSRHLGARPRRQESPVVTGWMDLPASVGGSMAEAAKSSVLSRTRLP